MIKHQLNDPVLWKSVVDILQPFFESPLVLAGGSVRDHLMSGEAKDLDLFVNVDNEFDLEFALDAMREAGIDVSPSPEAEAYKNDMAGQTSAAGIAGVLNVTLDGCPFPVQLIALPLADWSGKAVIERFDYGLVKAFWTEATGIVRSEHFVRDFDSRTCTPVDGPVAKSTKLRMARLRDKYPDFFVSLKLVYLNNRTYTVEHNERWNIVSKNTSTLPMWAKL